MCGIIGIIGRKNAIEGIVTGLLTMQHRGQDAAGATTYSSRFNTKKGLGLVKDVFNKKNMARLAGETGIGHVRYPTAGSYEVTEAQPFYTNTPFGIALAHNGNIINYTELKQKLQEEDLRYINSGCDAELILNELAARLSRRGAFSIDNLFHAVSETFNALEGSYSVVSIIGKKGMLSFRDPHGFKPLIFGKSANSYAFASESVTLDVLEYDIIDDVAPGEAIFVDTEGTVHRRILRKSIPTPCIFEWIYFARPDSTIDGISVYEARYQLGKRLATDVASKGIKPDVVIPVPDTSRAAALALAEELRVPYREGLIKNRYIGRTFIMARQTERRMAVRMKLNPIRSVIEGKKVLLVDDSIVRGNTSREIINLVRISGAKEVYFAAYAPPLRYPCIYGIDMQTKADFIAEKKTIEAIGHDIGADRLLYQSMDGLLGSMQLGAKKEFRFFCTSCFDGNYPTKVDEKVFAEIEKDRIASKATTQ